MTGKLGVWLNSTRVGELTNIPGDYNVFAFDDAYRGDPARPVLSQSLIGAVGEPMHRIPRTHTIAPPFFANLLPEPDTLLRQLLARQQQIKLVPDFPFLHALGDDLPGAVRLLEEESTSKLPEDAEDLVHEQTPPDNGSALLAFSLAGVQLKFSASMRGDRLTIPSKGGSWIIKLPTNTYARLPENEYAMMRFAGAIGLNIPKIHLVDMSHVSNIPEGLPALRQDEPPIVYVIARFDHLADGTRVHGEDFNQIAGQFPADKYEHKSMHYIASVVDQLCPSEDLEELIARIIFGIAIGNNDMHLKNWGVVYPDGRNARLAPLYDYVCTKVYFPDSVLTLSVGGEKRYDRITKDILANFAERAELSSRGTLRIAGQTIERITDVWPLFKQTIDNEHLVKTLDAHMKSIPLFQSA